jgi:uncharacterized protein (TIGR03067 family)
MKKEAMIRIMSLLTAGAMAALTASCVNTEVGGSTPKTFGAAQKDYELLSGTWQLTRGVENGKPVPASVLRNTILITDHNTFRFPKASGVGTHPAGTFTVNPNTRPKQVDSIAVGGPHAGQLTRGIYEILDPTHKRACWGQPGGPRPTEFESPPGSGWILQYWKKIGPVPSH